MASYLETVTAGKIVWLFFFLGVIYLNLIGECAVRAKLSIFFLGISWDDRRGSRLGEINRFLGIISREPNFFKWRVFCFYLIENYDYVLRR